MPLHKLSKKGIEQIHKAVDNVFDRAKARVLGPASNPKGILFHTKASITLPGIYNNAVEQEGVSVPEASSLDSLLKVAGSYLDASRERTKAQVVSAVQGYLASASVGTIDTDFKTALGGQLAKVFEDATNNLHTIVDTEATKARNVGILEGIVKANAYVGREDPVVFFVVVRDNALCDECKRLHLMPDEITPRCWYLSELGHSYHKKGEENPKVGGLHPHCFVAGSSRIHTSNGLERVESLFERGGENIVFVDNRVKVRRDTNNQFGVEVPGLTWYHRHASGTHTRTASHMYDTGVQQSYRVALSSGHVLEVSKGHEMWVDDGCNGAKVKVENLAVGAKVPVVSGECGWGQDNFPDLAELMGNLMGDGTIGNTAEWRFFGNDIEYGKELKLKARKFAPELEDTMRVFPPNEKYNVASAQFNSTVLAKVFVNDFGLSKKPRRVPERLWTANKETVAAFLRGLYAADGHSESISVVLAQNDKDFLREIQILLNNFGLSSRIFAHGEETEKQITYANGDTFNTKRKPCWRLSISGYEQIQKFASEIGLGVPAKQDLFLQRIADYKKGLDAKKTIRGHRQRSVGSHWRTARVESIEDIGLKQTYCLTEPWTNTVTVNGVVTGQCRCALTTLMDGYGFDRGGMVTYVSKDHREIEKQRATQKKELSIEEWQREFGVEIDAITDMVKADMEGAKHVPDLREKSKRNVATLNDSIARLENDCVKSTGNPLYDRYNPGQYNWSLKYRNHPDADPDKILEGGVGYGTALLRHPNYPKLVQKLKDANVTVNFPISIAADIKDSGVLKNLFETGTGMGNKNQSVRANWENKLFDFPVQREIHPPNERPIYGALHIFGEAPHSKSHGAAKHYGDAHFVLKPHVKDRCTYSPGDSSGCSTDDMFHSSDIEHLTKWLLSYPAGSPLLDSVGEYASTKGHALERLYRRPGLFDYSGYNYVEAHIHGGVDLSKDVDRIVWRLTEPSSVKFDRAAMESLAQKYNLPLHMYCNADFADQFGIANEGTLVKEGPNTTLRHVVVFPSSQLLTKSTSEGLKHLDRIKQLSLQNAKHLEYQEPPLVEDLDLVHKHFSESPITINFPSYNIEGIGKSGRFYNLFDTNVGYFDGHGEGESDKSIRAEHEERIFGFKPFGEQELKLSNFGHDRPVYGALFTGFNNPNESHSGGARMYGKCWAVLHDHIKERTTYTPSDSFISDEYHMFHHSHLRHFARGLLTSISSGLFGYSTFTRYEAVKGLRTNGYLDKRHSTAYIEAQVHGGVYLDKDVKELHVQLHHRGRIPIVPQDGEVDGAQKLRVLGAKYNIPVFYHLGDNTVTTTYPFTEGEL